MEIEHDIKIEEERDHKFAYTTFLSPASAMPTFSEEDLANSLNPEWRRAVVDLFREVEGDGGHRE
jgi:hypothetical protein